MKFTITIIAIILILLALFAIIVPALLYRKMINHFESDPDDIEPPEPDETSHAGRYKYTHQPDKF